MPVKSGQHPDILHIVRGRSTAGAIYHDLPPGNRAVLESVDSLDCGPVLDGLSLSQLKRLRAGFWAEKNRPGWRARFRQADTEFATFNRGLRRFRNFKEVVLWYDTSPPYQLFLIQMLAWFAEQDLRGCRLSSIGLGCPCMPKRGELQTLLQGRQQVTAAQLRVATRAWKAFTAKDPALLNRFLTKDPPDLPSVGPALLAMAREYPSAGSGLSRIERLLLEDLAVLGRTKSCRLIANLIVSEHCPGYGDGSAMRHVHHFLDSPNQLICFAEPFTGNRDTYEFNGAVLELTDFGRKALAGEVDVIPFNGIDRWIGGVHLHGQDCPWRWLESERKIIRIA